MYLSLLDAAGHGVTHGMLLDFKELIGRQKSLGTGYTVSDSF